MKGIDDGVQNYTSKHGDLEVHFFVGFESVDLLPVLC
jgi:hypothetical protein